MSNKIWFVGLLAPLFLLSFGNKKVNMEKIIFHSSGCEGACPEYSLQVDSNRKINLHSIRVYTAGNFPLDSSKMGYFTGILSDSLFGELNNIIQKMDIENLSLKEKATPVDAPFYRIVDAPFYTIIVYYDGKRKVLTSSIPSEKVYNLISILLEICENADLQRTSKLNIEGDADIN